MAARLGMDLLAHDQEAILNLFRGYARGPDRRLALVNAVQQRSALDRKPLHLPGCPGAPDSQHIRPERSMHQRGLPTQQLDEQHVGMVGQLIQDRENRVRANALTTTLTPTRPR